jgi:hypothetical protein
MAMAEPTSTAVATLIASGAAVPLLTLFGVPLGLRPDQLLAGFLGAIVAIGFLNSVPSTGDTLRELLRTTWRRISVVSCSALTAGYLTPVIMFGQAGDLAIMSTPNMLGISFVIGAGAQYFLRLAIVWLSKKLGLDAGVTS